MSKLTLLCLSVLFIVVNLSDSVTGFAAYCSDPNAVFVRCSNPCRQMCNGAPPDCLYHPGCRPGCDCIQDTAFDSDGRCVHRMDCMMLRDNPHIVPY